MLLRISIPLLGAERTGGIRIITEYANGLVKKGHTVTIITPFIKQYPFYLDDKVRLIVKKKSVFNIWFNSPLFNYYFLLKNILKYSDIVISNYYLTFYVGYIAENFFRKKHVYFIQGYEAEFFESSRNILNRLKNALAKKTYTLNCTLRITVSKFIKEKLSNKSTKVISNGTDTKVFNPFGRSVNNTSLVISAIVSHEKRKGFFNILDAIEIIYKKRQDFKVLFFTSFRIQLPKTSFPFEIIYPLTDKEMSDCYRLSNIFVFASHHEGFGLPPLEAMASGCAVVTTSCGGIDDYVTNNINALVVPVQDIDSIANAINSLLDDNDLRDTIICNGIKTANYMNWDNSIHLFEKELYSVISQ